LACSDETEAELPRIVGGVNVGLDRTFKIIDNSRPCGLFRGGPR
jgi:hypothetical protein